MQADCPRVTVAILAYNRRDAVRTTLTKVLRDLSYPGDSLEVIVVDNASRDGVAGMVAREFPGVRLIRLERNVGTSGWNSAFSAGSGEWFLVLDDDCYVDGDALSRALAAARAHGADLVSFRVRSSEDPSYLFNDEYPTGLMTFWGCSCLVSRRAIERVGGFDPEIFIWGHELEFTIRLLDAGLRHLYLPDVVSVHMKAPGWAEPAARRARRFNYRHWGYTAAKLLQPGDALRVTARQLASIAVDTAAHSPRDLAAVPQLLAGFARGLRRRRRPVRPEVSAAYRDNFVSFANQLEVLVAPGERLRRALVERDSGAFRRDVPERWRRFCAERPRYYPREAAALEILSRDGASPPG